MKKILFSLSMLLSIDTYANQILTGKQIAELKAHANPYMTPTWSNKSYITLTGVSSGVPGCSPTNWSNGLIPFYLDNSNAGLFSLILTAKVSSLDVNIYVNNTVKNDGVCKIEYLGIG